MSLNQNDITKLKVQDRLSVSISMVITAIYLINNFSYSEVLVDLHLSYNAVLKIFLKCSSVLVTLFESVNEMEEKNESI